MIFVDGMGVGRPDPEVNPLAASGLHVLKSLVDESFTFMSGVKRLTDPRLGVTGLPQSATNQTTLYTGRNAAAEVGGHVPGFPGPSLQRILSESNLLKDLHSAGYAVTFANAYTPSFFESRPRHISVTTRMCEDAGIRLRTLEDLRAGKAVFMDFSNRMLLDRGFEARTLTPEEAAGNLLGVASRFDLTLYEFFLTDLTGHRGSLQDAIRLLRELDLLLAQVIRERPQGMSILLTSDHGNIEEMDHGRHTRNPIMTFAWGALASRLQQFPGDLTLRDIRPLIEGFLRESRG